MKCESVSRYGSYCFFCQVLHSYSAFIDRSVSQLVVMEVVVFFVKFAYVVTWLLLIEVRVS